LVLNNPTLTIANISYNQIDNSVNVECVFNEEIANYKHSRIFSFDNADGKELTSLDVLEMIKKHNILKVFK